MKDARYFLMVKFTVETPHEPEVLRWLDGGHAAEVAAQPGFLWCKRLKLDQGGFVMLYGIESRAAFDAYESNKALKAKFAKERAPFEKYMRIERLCGEVERAYEA